MNCSSTVIECLESVASQTYLAREHIVIDGCSQDGTLEILEAHKSQLEVLISEPDFGIYDALNKGIVNSNGDVIGFLHSDDLYFSPNILQKVAKIFEDQSISAVYGNLDYVQKHDINKVVRSWVSCPYDPKKLSRGWMPPHPTLFVRREWYDKKKEFEIHYKISADYDSILRLFMNKDFKAIYIPEVLVKMRMGGVSNRSLLTIATKSYEDYTIMQKLKIGGLRTLFYKNISKLVQFFQI